MVCVLRGLTDQLFINTHTHSAANSPQYFSKNKEKGIKYIKVKMAEGSEQKEIGQFSEEYFTHVLSEGEEDYDDYTEQDLLEHPELAYTDEQVQQEKQKLSAQEKQVFEELQAHHLLQYRTRIHV